MPGVIAFDLPELMGRLTWFEVSSHGYEVSKDGFGARGVQRTPEPGKTLKIEVARTIIARRLGRLTGAGLFAESQKLGREMDWQESGVLGSDSVLTAVHGGRIFWAWGDTNLPDYWLGIFDTSSATTSLSPLKSLEPPLRLKFDYFRDPAGRPRGVAKLPGSGPTWLSAYVSLPDKSGRPRLVATYSKIKPPLETYECGLCVWNEEKAAFQRRRVLWTQSDPPSRRKAAPGGHPAFWKDRRRQVLGAFRQSAAGAALSGDFRGMGGPGRPGKCSDRRRRSFRPATAPRLNRTAVRLPGTRTGAAGSRCSWRRSASHRSLAKSGMPRPTGPTGPWGKAVKVLSHRNYTFYNPRLHPELTPANSPVLLFEGTYSQTFADRPLPTPRYDYNQILYRLDLE